MEFVTKLLLYEMGYIRCTRLQGMKRQLYVMISIQKLNILFALVTATIVAATIVIGIIGMNRTRQKPPRTYLRPWENTSTRNRSNISHTTRNRSNISHRKRSLSRPREGKGPLENFYFGIQSQTSARSTHKINHYTSLYCLPTQWHHRRRCSCVRFAVKDSLPIVTLLVT
jgi:hypothetical protein